MYEFGQSKRHGEVDEYDIHETLRDSSCTITIPGKPSFLSFAINGVIARVSGGHSTSSSANYDRPSVYYVSKSVTSGFNSRAHEGRDTDGSPPFEYRAMFQFTRPRGARRQQLLR